MAVPVNGALGRLVFKFLLLALIILFFVWTVSKRKNADNKVVEMETRLQFAQEQLSSLHAQIDVITRHKEKLEQLRADEQEHSNRLRKEQTQRIADLEAENQQLGNIVTRLNRTITAIQKNASHNHQTELAIEAKFGPASDVLPAPPSLLLSATEIKGTTAASDQIKNLTNLLEINKQNPLPDNVQHNNGAALPEHVGQRPPMAAVENKHDEDEQEADNGVGRKQQLDNMQRLVELEQRDQDPFHDPAAGGGDNKQEKMPEQIVDDREETEHRRQIVAPMPFEGPRQNQKQANEAANPIKLEPNGGEKTVAEEEEEEAARMPAITNDRNQNVVENNYVFRRAKPRADLVFDRPDGEAAADENLMINKKLMPNRELMRKLDERRALKQQQIIKAINRAEGNADMGAKEQIEEDGAAIVDNQQRQPEGL